MLERLEKTLETLTRRPLWPVPEAPRSPQGLPYASFNRRMLASMIDAAILTLLLLPFNDAIVAKVYGSLQVSPDMTQMLLQSVSPEQSSRLLVKLLAVMLLLLQIQYAVLAGFSFACWHFWSATPGKLVLSMRIVDFKTGARVTDWQGFVRIVGYAVSGAPLMLGFFAICWNRDRRGWHDRMAGTAVVIAKSRPPAAGRSGSPAPSATE